MHQDLFCGDFADHISQQIEHHGYEKIFVVTGKTSFVKSRAQDILSTINGLDYCTFTDFAQNPKFHDVAGGIQALQSYQPDCVLALGGGSAIDFAKLLVALSPIQGDIQLDVVTGKQKIDAISHPLWVAPTTSGSGSETTHFAVVYVGDDKYSLASPHLLPSQVFLDAKLTYSTPHHVTLCAGVDALCQSLESYWATGGTDASRTYALQGLDKVIPHLHLAVDGDKNARNHMQMGAYHAGQAINISKTTAGHAFAYYLTQNHNIMHGHAVVITLSHVIEYGLHYYRDDVERCLSPVGQKMDCAVDDIPGYLRNIVNHYDLPSTVQDIPNMNYDAWCDSVNVERLGNNPFLIDMSQFKQYLGV